jgi:hypothetical protein
LDDATGGEFGNPDLNASTRDMLGKVIKSGAPIMAHLFRHFEKFAVLSTYIRGGYDNIRRLQEKWREVDVEIILHDVPIIIIDGDIFCDFDKHIDIIRDVLYTKSFVLFLFKDVKKNRAFFAYPEDGGVRR